MGNYITDKNREDIATCQKNDKTILLSIGGATYSEGGFDTEKDANAGAELLWKTFGPAKENNSHLPARPDRAVSDLQATATTQAPLVAELTAQPQPTNTGKQSPEEKSGLATRAKVGSSTIYRPFGNSSVDGFDLDFESVNTNMSPFASRLRKLMDSEKSKKYFLTAAPQCPYPDAADKAFLNGPDPVFMDAIWVQFYNNPCGVDSFTKGSKQSAFNFETWDNWAKNGSKNANVKVMVGVPGDKGGANTGYLPASELKPVIEYSKKFDSFGGVMIWDVTQAYGNKGFIPSVKDALKGTASRVLRYPFRRNNA